MDKVLLEWYKPSESWIETSVSTQKLASRIPAELSIEEDLEDTMFTIFLKNWFDPRYAFDYVFNHRGYFTFKF